MINDIKKSILSGIMISVGGCIYLSCISLGYKWLGSILFAAGLYTICQYGFNLYTGKVGYIATKFKDFSYLRLVLLILLFNIITTYVLGILCAYVFGENITKPVTAIYQAKLNNDLIKLFVSGIFCGILMYLAVDTWKQGSKIGCFIYIPVFILSGFDHSIANSFYNGAYSFAMNFNDVYTLTNLWVVLVVIVGNACGGMIVPLLTRTWKAKKEQTAENSEQNQTKQA